MDKLKPILAQKFWILFSVALIMPVVGYFMTKGKLAAEIDERWKKLDTTFTGIPSGSGVPNDSWTNKLNEINASQKLHNIRANQELWLKQKERMFWPKEVAPYMANAEYFKELTAEQKGDQVLFKYPRSYESQIRALWESVDPLDDGVNLRDSNKRRKVAFAMADLHQSPRMYLGDIERSFAEIWGAQEDIWLQTELLQAIRRLNANAISQGDASVKQLGKILLFGGTKSTGDASASTAAGVASGAGTEMSFMMPSGFGGTGGRSESTSALSAEINLAEEFEVSKESGGTSGNAAAAMTAAFSNTAAMPDSGDASSATTSDVKRYLDLDEKQPYKRRAFYIKVIMDHQKVPDLIAELMNSPFPVEIVRVQQVWLSDSGTSGSGGGLQGLMSGGGPSSFPSFNPMPRGDGTDSFTAPTTTNFEGDGVAGVGGTGIGGSSGRTGTNNPGSAAALADPNLAQVAILGVWTLYLPPPPAADAGQAAPADSSAPPAGLAATPETAISPADPAADTTATEAKSTTTEASDGTSDEPKKSDNPEAPKSEAAKPEKADADPDKPEAEKAPPKAEATN